MKYRLSSNTKNYEIVTLEEIIHLLNHEIDTEEFLVVERHNDDFSENHDYMQTTINTGDDSLFWVETRHYYSDEENDFSHYRLKCDELETVENAFTAFFNETIDFKNWEDVTAEFK